MSLNAYYRTRTDHADSTEGLKNWFNEIALIPATTQKIKKGRLKVGAHFNNIYGAYANLLGVHTVKTEIKFFSITRPNIEYHKN